MGGAKTGNRLIVSSMLCLFPAFVSCFSFQILLYLTTCELNKHLIISFCKPTPNWRFLPWAYAVLLGLYRHKGSTHMYYQILLRLHVLLAFFPNLKLSVLRTFLYYCQIVNYGTVASNKEQILS